MDTTQLLTMAGFSTTGVAILAVLYKVWHSVKGRRFVSDCCGKKISVGVNTEDMTPRNSLEVRVPVAEGK